MVIAANCSWSSLIYLNTELCVNCADFWCHHSEKGKRGAKNKPWDSKVPIFSESLWMHEIIVADRSLSTNLSQFLVPMTKYRHCKTTDLFGLRWWDRIVFILQINKFNSAEKTATPNFWWQNCRFLNWPSWSRTHFHYITNKLWYHIFHGSLQNWKNTKKKIALKHEKLFVQVIQKSWENLTVGYFEHS